MLPLCPPSPDLALLTEESNVMGEAGEGMGDGSEWCTEYCLSPGILILVWWAEPGPKVATPQPSEPRMPPHMAKGTR